MFRLTVIHAKEKLEWYALRWMIEVFHKILKSGCKAEESKLRTTQRVTNLISLFCILSWRVFWMTMLNRSTPDAPPILALTGTEIGVLDRLVNDKPKARRKTLSHYLIKVARLGGYLARASDSPPCNTVMWRGLSHLTDIAMGAVVRGEFVGNLKASPDGYGSSPHDPVRERGAGLLDAEAAYVPDARLLRHIEFDAGNPLCSRKIGEIMRTISVIIKNNVKGGNR